MSPAKGGSDVHDSLISTQRGPHYIANSRYEKPVTKGEINNISGYVEHNLGRNVQKRYEEHR